MGVDVETKPFENKAHLDIQMKWQRSGPNRKMHAVGLFPCQQFVEWEEARLGQLHPSDTILDVPRETSQSSPAERFPEHIGNYGQLFISDLREHRK